MKKTMFALLTVYTLTALGCSAMNGVNVGTGVSLPGGIGVGANKTIGTGQDQNAQTSKTEASKKQGLKLFVFDCGRLRLNDVQAFGLGNADTIVRELFVPCYLIEHPTQGRLLWDAGLPLAIAGKGEQPLDGGSTQEYQTSLLKQLAALGLRPKNIDYVAFSHMHFDHVGAANAFTDSTLLIQETEYDAAFRHAEDFPIFDYALYQELATNTKTLLSGDHDVFGDGSTMLISTPGHTPGHQVLLLQLEELGPLVIAGDLYHFEASRRLRSVPTFNHDKAQTLESMDRVERLLKDQKATLWIEHNMALARTLKLAPKHYQ